MTIAFTSNFMGANTNYYMRLSMGVFWIILWAIRSKGILKTNSFLRYLIFPWLCIFFLTLLLWMINKPQIFDFSYVTRMCSNVLYCVVATLNAYIGIEFFGKDVLKLSFSSLLISIGFNLISVWMTFGTSNVLEYMTSVLTANYQYGSVMEAIAKNMEVQGATMALGVYFVYYLFFNREEDTFHRLSPILLSLCGLYLGFKRVVVLGIVVVICILWVMKYKKNNIRNIIMYAFIVFAILSFGYIVIAKTSYISLIAAYFNVDLMGRNNIYRTAAELFEISPFYLGIGFGYAAKYLYDTTGFAVHSDIMRMYMELGFLPFIAWLWYYIYLIPQKVVTEFGTKFGRICITITVFVFSTFLVENTLGLYPLHYALTLFTLLRLTVSEDDDGYIEE